MSTHMQKIRPIMWTSSNKNYPSGQEIPELLPIRINNLYDQGIMTPSTPILG